MSSDYYDSHTAIQNWANRRIPNNASKLPPPGSTTTPGANGQYYWSDGRYAPIPEPRVPIATGYQAGSPTGLSYGMSMPVMELLNKGIPNLNATQTAILFQAASNMAGYDAYKNPGSTLGPAWEFAVEKAATEGADPMEILSWMARSGSIGARFGPNVYPQVGMGEDSSSSSSGGGGGGGGGTTTVTTTNVTSKSAAQRLVNQALTGYLGREATGEERRRFLEALNQAERDNPTVQTISASGNTQSQVIEQGLDVGQFAQTYAESRPDYAEYRAATDLMDTFLGILQGPVS